MASFSFLVSLLVLVCLCLHAFVYGVQGREVQGLKKERKLNLHNDSTLITSIQEGEFVFPTTYHPYDENSKLTNYFATYQTQKGNYFGTKATINVWGHDIKYPSASSAEIWVLNEGNGSLGNTNTVQAGWHVNPALYKDSDTHFFILWTADGYRKTGCYNLNCPGFVHTNSSRLVPGHKLQPLSDYDGNQYYITLKIYKDPQTGDWLLFEGYEDATDFVGYWPKSLFTTLSNSASRISIGGVVTCRETDKTPPMGSGHFSSEDEGRAASFKHIQLVNDKGDLYDPKDLSQRSFVDTCYTIGESGHSSDGFAFYYGGPGGCNND